MIQRVQTLYILIVGIFSLFGLFRDLGTYNVIVGDVLVISQFSNFLFKTTTPEIASECSSPWALGALLILVTALTPLSLLSFRKRMAQMRYVLLQAILLLGYIGVYVAFAVIYRSEIAACYAGMEADISFEPTFSAVLPVLSFIFCCLAIKSIRKDEALVRSLDRLR